VPVVSLSAGGDGGFSTGAVSSVFSNVTNLKESAQAYLIRTGIRKRPVCIGFVFKEKRRVRRKKRAKRATPAAPTPPAGGADTQCPHIADIDTSGAFPGDAYIRQGKAKVVVTSDGTIVLDNKESNQPDGLKTINIQLAETGSLRISRVPDGGNIDEAEANERLLLGKATRKYIDGRDPYTNSYESGTLGAYIASLEARIATLENALTNWTPVPNDGGAALNVYYKAQATTDEGAYSAKWGSSYPAQPRSSTVLEAASVRIAAQGLAEGECD